MARKRFSDEDILNLLRQIELALSSGSDVQSACRAVGISDATYYSWRKRYGGMAKSQPFACAPSIPIISGASTSFMTG